MGRPPAEIKIEIQDLRQLGFTSLDVIQGIVFINVFQELSLCCIEIKLVGVSVTVLNYKISKDSDKISSKEEKHVLVNDSKILFPNKETSTLTPSKDYSLRPGAYEFQFQFKIPLNNSCLNLAPTRKKSSNSLFQLPKATSSEEFLQHEVNVLPPSLYNPDHYYHIHYYLEATIVRSSRLKSDILKSNFIKLAPFNDVDNVHKSAVLNYVRKGAVFRDKLPEIIAVFPKRKPVPQRTSPQRPSSPSNNGRLKSIFYRTPESTPPSTSPINQQEPFIIHAFDVPFYFEARSFGHLQTIGEPVDFKLYVLSSVLPSKYLGFGHESSGLGSIYLKKLRIDLLIKTNVRAHDLFHTEVKELTICSMKTQGKLDLAYAIKSKSVHERTGEALYELEIPPSLLEGCRVPRQLAPTFNTCNIKRSYKYFIEASFSETKDSKTLKKVNLTIPITLLGGIPPPLASESIPPSARLPSYDDALIEKTSV